MIMNAVLQESSYVGILKNRGKGPMSTCQAAYRIRAVNVKQGPIKTKAKLGMS